jgi:hypothetical protein
MYIEGKQKPPPLPSSLLGIINRKSKKKHNTHNNSLLTRSFRMSHRMKILADKTIYMTESVVGRGDVDDPLPPSKRPWVDDIPPSWLLHCRAWWFR